MNFNNETLLIIAPHPDDEILGCFGLINKIKQNGGKVFIQIMTLGGYSKFDGKKISKVTWKSEFQKVIKYLDIDAYDIAYYDDKISHLDIKPQSVLIDILEKSSKVSISKIKPSIVAIPTIFSTHQDHTHTYKAALAALRAHPQYSVHSPKMILSYEAPEYYFWSAYSEFGKFSPNFYLELSDNEIKKKISSLNIYQSQLQKDKRDGKQMTSLASIRGSEIGVDYAEAFHIHRFFINS